MALSEGQQSDPTGVDLANELRLRQILPVEYKASSLTEYTGHKNIFFKCEDRTRDLFTDTYYSSVRRTKFFEI